MRFFVDAAAECPIKNRPTDWYLQWWTKKYQHWEDRTFDIFDMFLDPRHCFIDVGAWIGPTVLYAAAKAKHIYCFEPDPEAYRVLRLNLAVNPQYHNVTALNAALSDSDGSALLSSPRPGDSESTLIPKRVEAREAINTGPLPEKPGVTSQLDALTLVEVPTITMDTVRQAYSIDGCSLMKIDIEGGERIAVPALEPFLRHYRPALYLSLHWMRLTETEIGVLFDLLSSIYDFIYDDSLLRGLDRKRLLTERLSSIVCVSTPLSAVQRLRVRRMRVSRWLRGTSEFALQLLGPNKKS